MKEKEKNEELKEFLSTIMTKITRFFANNGRKWEVTWSIITVLLVIIAIRLHWSNWTRVTGVLSLTMITIPGFVEKKARWF